MFIHALVFIRCMKWTLILSAASLRGPKITEQISRKIGGEHGPLRRTLGTLGESNPLPHPLLDDNNKFWRRYKLTRRKCNDCWNFFFFFFFIMLMLFESVFVLSCYLFAKWARLYILLFFCLQILTSAPAVLMTVTVHLLLVPTQWDPLVVHVIILPAEMAELAIYLQVTRKIYSVTKPAAIHLWLMHLALPSTA